MNGRLVMIAPATLVAFVVAVVAGAGSVVAQTPHDVPATPASVRAVPRRVEPPATIRQYWPQLLGADVASLAVVALSVDQKSDATLWLGGVGFLLAAPAVHLFNGNGSGALKSVGIRTALPLLGMVLGNAMGPRPNLSCAAGTSPCNSPSGSWAGMLVGGGLGLVTAAIIDYSAFGNKTERPSTWRPTIGASAHGASVGAMGQF